MSAAASSSSSSFVRDRATWLAYCAVGLFAFLQSSLIFWLAPIAALNLAGLFLTGLGTANLFPATYSSALDAAPGQPDIASARLAVCGGSAVLLIPLILGLLADAIGIALAFGIVLPLVAGALTMVILAQRTLSSRGH